MRIRSFVFAIARLALCACLLVGAQTASAADSFRELREIPLWGDKAAPGTRGVRLTEKWVNNSFNPLDPERDLEGISTPSLSVFIPRTPNGAAMIVVPGGGYRKNVFDKEGVEIARWLTSIGVTAFVLKYRLPAEWPEGGRIMARQDGQRALRLVRTHAADWQLDPARIGVIGFSAGGHLAASLGTGWQEKLYEPLDASDKASARPDAMVLVYGAMDLGEVPPDTPPAFIVAADNDSTVTSERSARFYIALRQAQVRAELHIYRDGGHGFAIRKTNGLPVAEWTQQCLAWMRMTGFVPR